MDLSQLSSQQWIMVAMININFVFIVIISRWIYTLNQKLNASDSFLDVANESTSEVPDMDTLLLEERLLMVEKAVRQLQQQPEETVQAASKNVAYADAMGLARQGANISDITKQCYLSSSEAQLIKRMQTHEAAVSSKA